MQSAPFTTPTGTLSHGDRIALLSGIAEKLTLALYVNAQQERAAWRALSTPSRLDAKE